MSIVVCQTQDQRNESFYKKGDMSGLSFLQSMSDITAIVQNKAYVPPIEKRSVSKLNEKSLEMCTESLGTETGSENGDELSLLAFEATTTAPRVHPKPQEDENPNLLATKASTMSFPPPIKFVDRSKYSQMVRSYREDGRLVVQAIRVSAPAPCFVAERGEGRLRLCLSPGSRKEEQEEEEEEEEEEETEEEMSENMEGKSGNKKLTRLSRRCKENGRDPKPMTWKQQQFCVA